MAKRWRRSVSRITGIVRTFTLLLSVLCLLHIYQANVDSKNNLENVKRKKHMLFVAHEHKMSNNKGSPMPSRKAKVLENGNKSAKPHSSTCSHKPEGLVFVKTHKTASTTITNIVLRFAEKRQLVVGLPPERRWELGGYPAMFDSNIVTPQVKKYQVLCHHMRYHQQRVKRVMAPDAATITILRDPSECFESGFSFFRDWPYSAWFDDLSDPQLLAQFLERPLSYYNTSTPWYFRAKNYMAFDLGFDHERSDSTYAKYAVRKMDEWFDLVLITEKLDESLILLKELMCMDSYDDIVYIRLKVRQPAAKRRTSDEMKRKIRSWNSLDARLYDYYSNQLEQKIEAFGKNRMNRELSLFRKLLDETAERCVYKYDVDDMKPWVSRIRLKDSDDKRCVKLSWGEVKFGDYIREKQLKYTDTMSLHQPDYDELSKMLEEAQMKIIGEEGVRRSA